MQVRLMMFVCILVSFTWVMTVSAPERPPNIILILADDLGWGDVGFNGRTEWGTPNLDRLAQQGTVFRRWYVGTPICAPSRAVLMTGKYTIHCNVTTNSGDLPAEEVTIAEALKKQGYVTALFGKWHHGRPRSGNASYVHPMDQGFDEFFGFTNARHAWEHFPKELWHGREMKPVSGYTATLFTDKAIDFITRHKARPFFLYLSYTEPHFFIEAPEEDVAQFRGKFEEKDPARPYNAIYAAMITRLDKEIGRLMKALDDLGLAENTLVVFSSDNGATFEAGNQGASNYHDSNRPLRGHKRNLWEGGIRVPAVVRWTGRIPAGRVSDDIVHNIDILPTFLAAAGAEPDPAWKVDGINLLPVWTGAAPPPDRTLFWEWRAEGGNQIAAMRGNFKLVITGNNPPELFNLETDPAERRPINAEHPALVQQLRKELTDWLAREAEAAK
ncbi:MAG: sulfatase-like hydrolase/transferase [Abditibacteriales bacterium]|nr:sulfatase-like hydrolase/transferase [Abditibacteriales bacterium]MDW8364575.1 sulfatase-like hydrolase/transferase [Abditibacteriales bacterium]